MASDGVRARSRRVRWCSALMLFGIAVCTGDRFIRSGDGWPLYRQLNALMGYDGCLCGDCAPRLAPLGAGYQPTCRPGPSGYTKVFFGAVLAAGPFAGLLFGPAIVRRGDRLAAIGRGLVCECGYDLTGLPTRRCPECGREPRSQEHLSG